MELKVILLITLFFEHIVEHLEIIALYVYQCNICISIEIKHQKYIFSFSCKDENNDTLLIMETELIIIYLLFFLNVTAIILTQQNHFKSSYFFDTSITCN